MLIAPGMWCVTAAAAAAAAAAAKSGAAGGGGRGAPPSAASWPKPERPASCPKATGVPR